MSSTLSLTNMISLSSGGGDDDDDDDDDVDDKVDESVSGSRFGEISRVCQRDARSQCRPTASISHLHIFTCISRVAMGIMVVMVWSWWS